MRKNPGAPFALRASWGRRSKPARILAPPPAARPWGLRKSTPAGDAPRITHLPFRQNKAMVVYFAAALTAGFYLFHLPVRGAAEIWLGPGSRLRLGVGAFGRAGIWTLERPLSLANLSKGRGLKGKLPVKALKYLGRRTRIARLQVALSAGDACATALVCAVLAALLPPLVRRTRIAPVFDAPDWNLHALCIADALLGHIMVAALWCAASMTAGRLWAWINGRLKAS